MNRSIRGLRMLKAQQSFLAIMTFAIALLLHAGVAQAHPVAQGQLRVEVGDTAVSVRATVALEQAIIANAFRTDGPPAASTVAMLKAHGDYLAQHIRVRADGKRLNARVVAVPAAPAAGAQTLQYALEYRFRPGDAHPASTSELRIEQDVLNEIEFAPGNRWEATYVVQVTGVHGGPQQRRLLTSDASLVLRASRASPGPMPRTSSAANATDATLPAQADNALLLRDYFRFGVLHILTGYDHLLFIAALVLATVTLWDLLKIVSVFTLAHSLTLTLSVLNILRLPENVVEPVIAASIVLVALDNLLRPGSSRSNGRLAVAFAFGLFHGLGFAGGLLNAMQDLGGSTVALAIVAFSIGVELGHQVVVLPLFGLLAFSRRDAEIQRDGRTAVQALALRYGSGAILIAGSAYLFAAFRMV